MEKHVVFDLYKDNKCTYAICCKLRSTNIHCRKVIFDDINSNMVLGKQIICRIRLAIKSLLLLIDLKKAHDIFSKKFHFMKLPFRVSIKYFFKES